MANKLNESGSSTQKKLDAVHCFCCLLFNTKQDRGPWCNIGYRDWQHLSTPTQRHENSPSHLDNFIRWKKYSSRMSIDSTVELCLERQLLSEKKRLKLVFERLISITSYLARQNLAFAGKTTTSGNFYELVHTIAEFDTVMKNHIETERRNKYLSPESQNEFISIIGDQIRKTILNQIRQSKYFAIILDCTPDSSRKEQMTLVIRYVHFNRGTGIYEIQECFIEFLNVTDSMAKGLLM